MKMSKELTDKLRNAFGDQAKVFPTNKDFLDECFKKLNEQFMEGDTVMAKDVFELLGFDQEPVIDFEFKPSKNPVKPIYKTYEDLAYISAMEATRCHMLIDKLKATIDLLDAQQKYYEAMSMIERDNEMLGFDLSI